MRNDITRVAPATTEPETAQNNVLRSLKLRIFETMSIIDCEVSSCSTQTKTRHPGPIEEKIFSSTKISA